MKKKETQIQYRAGGMSLCVHVCVFVFLYIDGGQKLTEQLLTEDLLSTWEPNFSPRGSNEISENKDLVLWFTMELHYG